MSESTYTIPEHLHSLIATFAEMMTGDSEPETINNLLQWSIYTHIRSTMPTLASHWNQANPEDAEIVKQAIHQLKTKNEQWKINRK